MQLTNENSALKISTFLWTEAWFSVFTAVYITVLLSSSIIFNVWFLTADGANRTWAYAWRTEQLRLFWCAVLRKTCSSKMHFCSCEAKLQRLCSRLTALWRYINFVLLLLLLLLFMQLKMLILRQQRSTHHFQLQVQHWRVQREWSKGKRALQSEKFP